MIERNEREIFFKLIKKYLATSFIIFVFWEFLQSLFYKNTRIPIFKLMYDRIHCTIGDIMILSIAVLIWILLKRNFSWIKNPKFIDYFWITIFGVSYTLFSEIYNVQIIKSWTYSNLMPIIPFIHVGLVPVIQWLILPSLIINLSIRKK